MDDAPQPSRRTVDWEAVVLYGLFALCVIFALVELGTGWKNSILDRHAFRQTQTALTTRLMMQGGPWLAYETPVLGPPWAIPFEFPLYQWTVAAVCKTFGLALEPTGRLVNAVTFFAGLACMWSALGALGVARRYRTVFLDLMLVSPLYLFWSRTFMIESTALFWSLAYLACVAWYAERPRGWLLVVGAIAGTLAVLAKVTTFGPFGLAAALILGHRLVLRDWRVLLGRLWAPALAFAVVPLVVATRWDHYTETLREMNPLALGYVTGASLEKWVLGTWAQRLDAAPWHALYEWASNVVAAPVVWLAFGLVVATRRHLGYVAGSLVAYLSGYVVFFNVHTIHDYYTYANGLFLVAACGFALVGILEQRAKVWLGPALVAGVISFSALAYLAHPYHADLLRDHTGRNQFAAAVRAATQPDDVLLIYGEEWNPQIPYAAERRAVMDRDARPLTDPKMKASLALLPDGIAAMLVCGRFSTDTAFIQARVQALGLAAKPAVVVGACSAYLRPR